MVPWPEVAALLRLSTRTVRQIERAAFDKLRRHPELREFWRAWTGQIGEATAAPVGRWNLTDAEINALYAIVKAADEFSALSKLIGLSPEFSSVSLWSEWHQPNALA